MNGRRLFRKYAQSKGQQAKEFIKIEDGFYGDSDVLVTKDNKGREERLNLDYKNMVLWIVQTLPNPQEK